MTTSTLSYSNCVSCGAQDHRFLRTYPGFDGVDLVCCQRCGLMQSQPVPSEEFLARFYLEEFGTGHKNFEMSLEDEKGFRLRATMQYKFVQTATGIRNWTGRKVLDVGCHAASLLSLFKERGAEVFGVDPNPRSRYAKTWYGIDVTLSMFQRGMYPEGSFDLIAHSHVLEHLASPLDQMREFYRILKPGGYVFIEVPNESTAKVMKQQVKPHLTFFTPQTLSFLGREAGFKTVKVNVLGVDRRRGPLFSSEGLRWIRDRWSARYNESDRLDLMTFFPFHGRIFKTDRYFKGYREEASLLRAVFHKPSAAA